MPRRGGHKGVPLLLRDTPTFPGRRHTRRRHVRRGQSRPHRSSRRGHRLRRDGGRSRRLRLRRLYCHSAILRRLCWQLPEPTASRED